jgi:SnoaL-like polyketide cyclase
MQTCRRTCPVGCGSEKTFPRRVVDELVASNYAGHIPPPGAGSRPGWRQVVRHDVPDGVSGHGDHGGGSLAPDDLVATRWTSRGTQTGALMGIEPTGKHVTVSGVTVSRPRD